MERDADVKITEAIAATRTELEQAREVVRNLANELADVIDVVEPALEDHVNRIRQARMTSIDELRQVSNGIREMRDLVMSPAMAEMLTRSERFLAVMRELEEFRACGFLDAFVTLFLTAQHQDRRSS